MNTLRRVRSRLGSVCLLSGLALGGLAYIEYQSNPDLLFTVGSVALLLVVLGVFFDVA